MIQPTGKPTQSAAETDSLDEVKKSFSGLTSKTQFFVLCGLVSLLTIAASWGAAWAVATNKVESLGKSLEKHDARLEAIEDTGIVAKGNANRFKSVDDEFTRVHTTMKPVVEFKGSLDSELPVLKRDLSAIKNEYVSKSALAAHGSDKTIELQKAVSILQNDIHNEISSLRKELQADISNLRATFDDRYHDLDKRLLLLRNASNQLSMESSLDAYGSFAVLVSKTVEVDQVPTVLVALCDFGNHTVTMYRSTRQNDTFIQMIEEHAALDKAQFSLADIAMRNPSIVGLPSEIPKVPKEDDFDALGFVGLLGQIQFTSSFVFKSPPEFVGKYLMAKGHHSENLQISEKIDSVGKLVRDATQNPEKWTLWIPSKGG